jgi:thiol-disulfide isomerase/thioredoxin
MMKTKHLLAASCAAFLGFTSAFAGGEGWTHDFAAAKKQAADEKKDLLIEFTGSDWCVYCIKLNEQVFSHAPFKAGVKDKFVLVELDYPRKPENIAKLSDETKAQNKELQAKYSINAFPTIVLCDAEGRPYASTGFQRGGPEKYVTHLDELRAKKDVRDKSFAEAAKLEGLAKAKVLVAALDALSAMQLGDLTVARCYPDVVDQIKAADPKDETGYGKKLVVTAKFVDFYTEFQGLLAKQDMAGAIAFIEKSAASGDFEGEMKAQVISSKIEVLISMKKFDDAIKAVEEVKAVAPESQGIRKFEEYWKPEIEKAKAAAKGEEKPAEKIEK